MSPYQKKHDVLYHSQARELFRIHVQKLYSSADVNLNWSNMSKHMAKILVHYKHHPRYYPIKGSVNCENLDTEEHLATYLYNMYGVGKFNVLMYDKYLINKRYNPNFICDNKVRVRCKYGKVCQRTKIKIGMSCWKNKRHIRNWGLKARVEIKPSLGEKNFSYKFDHSVMKMQNYPFWKGFSRKERKVQEKAPWYETEAVREMGGL